MVLAFQSVAKWLKVVVERWSLVLDDERGRWYSPQKRWIEELCLVGPLLAARRFNDRDLSRNGEFGLVQTRR